MTVGIANVEPAKGLPKRSFSGQKQDFSIIIYTVLFRAPSLKNLGANNKI